VLGAVPAWFTDNLVAIAAITLGLLALLVFRTVQRAATRLLLSALLLGALLFVVLQRDQLTQCGRTCSCRVVNVDVDLPACEPELLPGG
jgi:hypothetical protein